ncbi:MAG: efflux RND transporter periplasmic adaptor subunit [Candidatus Liptonbacteria bacterium]|nr:efflux RND transporter periplasmic adaptor subunit [Candidatus Liptonbacteria bacterium]
MNYKKILSNKIAWIAAALVLLIAGYFYFTRSGGQNLETAKVQKRTITQEVSATGNVKPSQSVDLAFETSGKIVSVNAKVGDEIFQGQVLASIDSSGLETQLSKAKADLASQEASLNKSRIDLENYYGNVIDAVNSAYTSVNDAVRIKIDSLFSDDETNNPKLTFDSINSQQRLSSEYQRLLIRDMLNAWLSKINSLDSSSESALEQGLSDSKRNLKSVYDFLNLLMETTINALSLSSSTLNSYKTSINDARAEIDTATSAITTLSQNISSQRASIYSKEADIKSYQASVDNIITQISKTALRSSISGTVTRQDAKVGQIATANSTIASVISAGSYEIDSYIPEVDIARVKIGNDARVTLDAYGNDVIFEAKVTSIDPGETIIEGVSTYLTKLHFTKADERIKPGMTANIDVISAVHENVLSLPQNAVQKESNKEFVLIYKGGTENGPSVEERTITTGLRGVDGYVEVTGGLSENEEVVIFRPGKK